MATETTSRLARFKHPLRYVMGLFYAFAGVMHFVAPKVYEQVVPPSLPRPLDLVYLSGIAEIVLGVGVLFSRTRRSTASAAGRPLGVVVHAPDVRRRELSAPLGRYRCPTSHRRTGIEP